MLKSIKVSNMLSSSGNKVANQFLLKEKSGIAGNFISRETFQSYDSVIAQVTKWRHEDVVGHGGKEVDVVLDEYYWDYSQTTGKYRNQFLGETKKETQAKIDSGEYRLENLN